MAGPLPYKTLCEHHPDYLPHYWARCRGLYAGGRKLLGDKSVLCDVFPRNNAEVEVLYQERCHRAYYLNYAGSVINLIVAGLFEEAPHMEAEPEADEWYDDWVSDVSKPGGSVMSFNDLLKEQVLTALVLKRAWTLVELPEAPIEMPANLAAQKQSGALDCYAYPIEPECVRDWEMDADGALLWALLAFKRQKREGIESDRKRVEEEFVYYTPTEYRRYVIEYHVDKPPMENTLVPLVAEGTHSFGKVPLVVLDLTDGMWAMGKLESIAVAHMNTTNALTWATIKSLFPTPTAFVSAEQVGNEATADKDRAKRQARGPNSIVTMGDKDRFEFVGPSAEPFAQALSQCDRLRDEMYRVVHSMAASVDNSGAALQRSGESKQMDLRHTATVLKWLGQQVAKHAVELLNLIGVGRGDPEVTWVCHGMEEFDAPDAAQVLAEAQAVDTISIPSATFKQMYTYKVAKEVLGDDADGEALDKIKGELEANISNEQFMAPMMSDDDTVPGMPGDEEDEDEDEDSNPDKKPGKPGKPAPKVAKA